MTTNSALMADLAAVALSAAAAAAAAPTCRDGTVRLSGSRPAARRRRGPERRIAAVPVVLAAPGLGSVLVAGGAPVVTGWLSGALGLALLVLRERRWHGSRRHQDTTHRELDAAVEALIAELRAGRPPGVALAEASRSCSALEPVAAAARADAEVVVALRRAGRRAGTRALLDLAAAWQVAAVTGAPLVPTLTNLVAGGRDEAASRREASTELAGVRSTARLLAVLPVLVLGLAVVTGVDLAPVLRSSWWCLCVLAALGLVVVGLAWVDAIVGGVERRGRPDP